MSRESGNSFDSINYKVHTFGCKVNSYDSGLLQSRLHKEGFQSSGGEKTHVHVLNTCAVTAEATKEAVRSIRRIKAKDPLATVVVTGCAAQVDTEAFQNLSGADLVVANSHKSYLGNILKDYYAGQLNGQRVFKSNIFRKEDLGAGGGVEENHTRSFLKIQDGCNSFCTYCVIPFGRGKSRSLTINDLVRRIHDLESYGAQEVVLTGVHIGDYQDGEKKLEDLVEQVLVKTKIPRIRMTSLEPPEVSDRLLELYSDPRMCRHFHMSIQSATSSVLEKMKRQYTAQDVETSLANIQRKVSGAFVGMDVIVGFPQESEGEFKETYDRLSSLPWTRIHVFPYSSRPGTKAEKMDGHIHQVEIKKRSKLLRELSSERYSQCGLAQVDKVKNALVLKGNKALSRDYWQICLHENQKEEVLNQEVSVKITGFDSSSASRMDGLLWGEVISEPVRQ